MEAAELPDAHIEQVFTWNFSTYIVSQKKKDRQYFGHNFNEFK